MWICAVQTHVVQGQKKNPHICAFQTHVVQRSNYLRIQVQWKQKGSSP